ncbi:hypothetical protein MRX96_030384 [Rhipicephalus microplus]
MPSTWQKEPRPATYGSKPRHRSCTQGRPADQDRRVPHLPPAQVPGQGDSRQPRACCPNLPQQTASNAGPRLRARRVKNFIPKKRPVTRRLTATAAILGTPAIRQNWSACQETEIQASSSKEGGYPENTESEQSPSPQKSDAASSGSSPITDTSSPHLLLVVVTQHAGLLSQHFCRREQPGTEGAGLLLPLW